MGKTCAGALAAAIALSALLSAGCLRDADEEGAAGSGPSTAAEIAEPDVDGETPALTLTADLVGRWIASGRHDAVAPVLASIRVRATQDAPAEIATSLQQAIGSEELGRVVREHGFSGAEEWALVTARIMSGMVEALAQAHLDLATEMGIDEGSPEYRKAAKEVRKELAAAHEALGDLSEAEQKLVTDRLGDITAAMKGDTAPAGETEGTE